MLVLYGCYASVAKASNEDLERCLYNNGVPMPQRVCDSLRKVYIKDYGTPEQIEERKRKSKLDEELRKEAQAKYEADLEAQRQELARREAQRKDEERQRKEASDKERAADEKRYTAQERVAAQKTAAIKAECGADYKTPSVGMTLQRAQQCVGNFRLVGQINRADGVVSTYQAGRTYLHVMSGRIVSWGR